MIFFRIYVLQLASLLNSLLHKWGPRPVLHREPRPGHSQSCVTAFAASGGVQILESWCCCLSPGGSPVPLLPGIVQHPGLCWASFVLLGSRRCWHKPDPLLNPEMAVLELSKVETPPSTRVQGCVPPHWISGSWFELQGICSVPVPPGWDSVTDPNWQPWQGEGLAVSRAEHRRKSSGLAELNQPSSVTGWQQDCSLSVQSLSVLKCHHSEHEPGWLQPRVTSLPPPGWATTVRAAVLSCLGARKRSDWGCPSASNFQREEWF